MQTTSEYDFYYMYLDNRVIAYFVGCYYMFVLNNLLAHNLFIYLLKLCSLTYPSFFLYMVPSFFLCLVPGCIFLFAIITNVSVSKCEDS